MTAIACKVYKDKIVLGAESRSTNGDFIYSNDEQKIVQRDHIIFAGAGDNGILLMLERYSEYMTVELTEKDDDYFSLLAYMLDFNTWVDSQFASSISNEPNVSYSLIIIFNKKAYIYEPNYGLLPITTYGAIGSGGMYAGCALKLGKTVKQAIKFAIDSSSGCGGKIHIVEVEL